MNRKKHLSIEPLEARCLLSASLSAAITPAVTPAPVTYYVSNSGNNNNSGTSQAAPWQTIAKVNAMAFNPGDQILFQCGGLWRESLDASSSGTTANPITFGVYGNPALGNPVFAGSDLLDNTAFSLVNGTTSTFSMVSVTPIFWVYDNHQFMHESLDALSAAGTASTDPTTNINYVTATPESFYYDTASTTLYVNTGGSLSGHTLTGTNRVDSIFNNGQSNLVFQMLTVTETAQDNGGYGVRIQQGDNVQLLDCTATQAGKHAFGAIDDNNFLGQGLTASGLAPDLGFGGATGFVAFSDASRTGDTSQWINDTFINTNGAYGAFVTHGNPNAIASVLIKNMVSLNGYGSGIFAESTGPSEKITILGGQFDGGTVEVQTDNSLVDGVSVTGQFGAVYLDGTNDIAQNCLFNGIMPSPNGGHDGGVVDNGTNNIIRFNTFSFTFGGGPGIGITTATSNSHIYGNIFACPLAIWLVFNGSNGQLDSSHNVFASSAEFFTGDTLNVVNHTLQQWQALGYDTNSVTGDPKFTDASTGDFSLQTGSPAIDLVSTLPAGSQTITTDFSGNTRPIGGGYDAGAFEKQPVAVTASISVTASPVTEPAAGQTATETFTFTLSQALSTVASVNYSTADDTAIAGTDYTAASGTVSFPAGTTSQTVSVSVLPQTPSIATAKTFFLNLSNPVGATFSTNQVQAAITPAAAVAYSVSAAPVTQPLVNQTATEIFTVTLSQAASTQTTVDVNTADGTAVAGTDYDAVSSTLTFPAGVTSQSVPVTVLFGGVNSSAGKTFSLNLSNPVGASISSAQAIATITPLPPVTVQDFGGRVIQKYIDSNGRSVVLRLAGPGSGQALFTSADPNPLEILLTGTTNRSVLLVRPIGGVTTLHDIMVQGSLAVLSAPRATLQGNVTITGTSGPIVLGDVTGPSTLSIAQAGAPTSLHLGNVTDLAVNSAARIISITAFSWNETDPSAQTIQAPSVNILRVPGNFSSSMNLSGNLLAARIGGQLMGGTWSVGGLGQSLVSGAVSSSFTGTFTGNLAALVTLGNFAGALNAASVNVIHVVGDLTGTVNLSGNLGVLSVAGSIAGADVRTVGNMNIVSAGAVTDSTVFAGVDPNQTGLPTSASAFTTSSAITVFVVRGRPALASAFSNSAIAASTLKRTVLRQVQTNNSGTPFGFASHTLLSFVDIEPGSKPFVWTPRKSPTLLQFPGDFVVSLL